jgi:hypothetical protein
MNGRGWDWEIKSTADNLWLIYIGYWIQWQQNAAGDPNVIEIWKIAISFRWDKNFSSTHIPGHQATSIEFNWGVSHHSRVNNEKFHSYHSEHSAIYHFFLFISSPQTCHSWAREKRMMTKKMWMKREKVWKGSDNEFNWISCCDFLLFVVEFFATLRSCWIFS